MTADNVRGVSVEDLRQMDPASAYEVLGKSDNDFAEAVILLERLGAVFRPIVAVPTIENTAPISDLRLSTRSENCLTRGGVRTVGELRLLSASRLMEFTNFGARSLYDVVVTLAMRGLTLSTGSASPTAPEARVGGRSASEWLGLTPSEALDALDGSFQDFAQTAVALERLGVTFRASTRWATVSDFASIDELDLDTRSRNCLVERAITTVGQLRTHSASDLMGFRAFGARSLFDVMTKLADRGLTLASLSEAPQEVGAQQRYTRAAELLIEQLVAVAGVHGQLDPSLTIRDAFALLESDVLSLRAVDVLPKNPEYYSLSARVSRIRDGLGDSSIAVFDARAVLTDLPSLADVAAGTDVTGEAVRRSEQRIAEKLAGDPLVAEAARLIARFAPVVPLATFEAAGLDLGSGMGAALLVARVLHGLQARTEMARHATSVGDVVVIASPSDAAEIINGSMTAFRSIVSRPEWSCGNVETLLEEIHPHIPLLAAFEPGSESFDRAAAAFLAQAPIWLDGEGRYVTAGSRAAFVEGYVRLGGEVAVDEITAVFDVVFDTDPTGSAYDRRVTDRLHEAETLVEVRPKVWAHTASGAQRVPNVTEIMRGLLEPCGDWGMRLTDLIARVKEIKSSAREDTIRSYAAAGLLFRLRDGRVTLGDGTVTADPERSSAMHRDGLGRWVWTGRRDDRQLYHSSMNVPPALFAAAGIRLGDDFVVRFPTGDARCGYSTNNVFFVSKGGVRDVLNAAGVMDGDEFRFVVTGERSMICERLAPPSATAV